MRTIDDIYTEGRPDSAEFFGEVVDTDDPKKIGRARVAVYGIFDGLPASSIPWAHPEHGPSFSSSDGGGSGMFSAPKKGTKVKVTFFNGNIYSPTYSTISRLSGAAASEIADSYENSKILAYDTDEKLKIVYTQAGGLNLQLTGSHITINKDLSITIEHDSSKSIIELQGPNINIVCNSRVDITSTDEVNVSSELVNVDGKRVNIGHAPAYSAVAAEPQWASLKALAVAVDAKLPISPGVNLAAIEAAELASTSKTVKVSL